MGAKSHFPLVVCVCSKSGIGNHVAIKEIIRPTTNKYVIDIVYRCMNHKLPPKNVCITINKYHSTSPVWVKIGINFPIYLINLLPKLVH